MGGTSREYLLSRLRKEGHFALVRAVENGDLSCYAAACEVGFVTRKPTLETGSQNMLRRRMFAIRNAYRDVDAQPPQDNGLASNESRPAAKDNPMVAGGVGDLPCLYCSHPQGQLARREIADVFLEAQLGNGNRRPASNGVLPRACCRRNAVALTAAALIG